LKTNTETSPETPIDLQSLAQAELTGDVGADLTGQPAGETPVRWTREYAASGGAKGTTPPR